MHNLAVYTDEAAQEPANERMCTGMHRDAQRCAQTKKRPAELRDKFTSTRDNGTQQQGANPCDENLDVYTDEAALILSKERQSELLDKLSFSRDIGTTQVANLCVQDLDVNTGDVALKPQDKRSDERRVEVSDKFSLSRDTGTTQRVVNLCVKNLVVNTDEAALRALLEAFGDIT